MASRERPSAAAAAPRLDAAAQLAWRLLLVTAAAFLLAYVLWTLRAILIPFLVGILVATQLVPLAGRLERAGLPPPLAVVASLLVGFGAILGGTAVIVGVLIAEITGIGDAVATASRDIADWIEGGPTTLLGQTFDPRIIADQISQLEGEITGAASSIFDSVVTGVTAALAAVAGVLFAITFAVYITTDSARLHRWLVTRLPMRRPAEFDRVLRRAWITLGFYVRGVAITAGVDAVLIGLGLLFLDVPFALALAVLIFVLSFVPIIGALVSGAVAVGVALADGGLTTALIVLLIVIAVQQFESLVVSPLVFRYSVSLHPVVTLLSVAGGVIVAGIPGAFLAVPIVAVSWAVIEERRRIRDGEAPAPELLDHGPLGFEPAGALEAGASKG